MPNCFCSYRPSVNSCEVLIFNFGLVKKLIPLFLLLCLAAPFVLTYSALKMQKHQLKRSIKHQIIDGIDKSELVLLKFSKHEVEEMLDWEHSKEFEFKNEMYDVVEKEETTDSISYWCWWDNEETKLNRQLASSLLIDWQQNDAQQQQNKLLIQYTKNWLSECAEVTVISDHNGFFVSHNTPYLEGFCEFSFETSSPPPKLS